MYTDQSFGGANRGPASIRPRRRRSNAFVDLGFFAVLIACSAIVAYQYSPLMATTGYGVALGHISSVHWRLSGRRRSFVEIVQADFKFTTGGRSYHSSVSSVPILSPVALGALTLQDQTEKNGLAVRFDPNNPNNCVPVEVINNFAWCAVVSYSIILAVTSILLVMAGMSNLSGEKYRYR